MVDLGLQLLTPCAFRRWAGRYVIKHFRKAIYRFVHRKELAAEKARQKQMIKEQEERDRKYQAQMQDRINRELHADKYL